MAESSGTPEKAVSVNSDSLNKKISCIQIDPAKTTNIVIKGGINAIGDGAKVLISQGLFGNKMFTALASLFSVVLCLRLAAAIKDFGNCEWNGNSSGHNENDKMVGVQQVTFRCSNGIIAWHKPRGGVRIEFKPPVDLIGYEFTVQLLSQFPAVNIFKENGNEGLQLLRGSKSHGPKSPIMIESSNGTAILYLEVADSGAEQVKIYYDLTPKSELSWSEECNMCSSEKLKDLFCNGDFAVKAKVENKYLHDDESHVLLGLLVYHVFHQSSEIFVRAQKSKHHIGYLTMPGKCSPPRGRHHYIMLGNIKRQVGAFAECYMKFSLWRMVMRHQKCSNQNKPDRNLL